MKKFDKYYKENECYWGERPTFLVKKSLNFIKKGNVFDIGVGEGRDSLYLANRGFNVMGIDSSKEAIIKFRKLAKLKKLKVNAKALNILDFNFKNYDLIIANSVLHFLNKNDIDIVIKKLKEKTNFNGINVITVFTNKNPNKNFPYLFKKDELKNYYSDWKILYYGEIITPLEKHGDGKPHRHAIARIIARRVK